MCIYCDLCCKGTQERCLLGNYCLQRYPIYIPIPGCCTRSRSRALNTRARKRGCQEVVLQIMVLNSVSESTAFGVWLRKGKLWWHALVVGPEVTMSMRPSTGVAARDMPGCACAAAAAAAATAREACAREMICKPASIAAPVQRGRSRCRPC